MSGKINVRFEDGSLGFCKVVENLGYNHDMGAYCKIVSHDGREFVVKKWAGKVWAPHTAQERTQPIRDHLERLSRLRPLD